MKPGPGGQASRLVTLSAHLGASVLDYYYLENQGTAYAMTLESFADGSTHNIVWYGVQSLLASQEEWWPSTRPEIPQSPKHSPGKGLVMISGVHPASPDLGIGSTAGHFDVAWALMNAAITQKLLPAF